MNNISVIVMVISAVLALSACSSTGTDRVKRPSYGGYTAYGNCVGCETAENTIVDHDDYGHNFQRSNDSVSAATVVGTLIVGGILFAAIGKSKGDDNDLDDEGDDFDDEDDDF